MRAVILAAGYGNRMKPLTETIHKTLLEVNGEKIIDRIISSLIDNNILKVTIVTGYLKDQLEDHVLKAFPHVHFQFINNPDYAITNNIHSLSLALEEIDDDIILIESDLIYDNSILTRLVNSRFENVALVDNYRQGMDGTVVSIKNDKIISIIPPHLQDSQFDFSDKYKTLNIYKFSREFLNTSLRRLLTFYSKTFNNNCYYEQILGILIYMQNAEVYAEVVNGLKWAEVDDPNDLKSAEFIFSQSKKELLDNSFGGYWNYDVIDYCFIWNQYFPTPAILSELKNALPKLLMNYGSNQASLNKKLAYFLGSQDDGIIALSGLSQLYPILESLYGEEKVLRPEPTFGEYYRFKQATAYDGLTNEIQEIPKDTNVVIVVSPNNPTGTVFNKNLLLKHIRSNPTKMFFVDESFIDFSNANSILNEVLKEKFSNVLYMKSLSKTLGVPGLRLGYCITFNTDLYQKITLKLPIWSMNSIAEFFLEGILKHKKTLNESINKTIKDRQLFINNLETIKTVKKVYPSGANFILVEFAESVPLTKMMNFMLTEHSIYLKDCRSKFAGKNFIRFAVKTEVQNQNLVNLIKSYIE